MSYCPMITSLLESAEQIRISNQQYTDEERSPKYRIVATAIRFGKKGLNLAAFNKTRCKPAFTEQEIAGLTEEVNASVIALNEAQRLHEITRAQDGVIPVVECDAIAFLSDNPMGTIREQYSLLHYGDDDALSTVLWGFCIKWMEVANDEGIHVIAVGERGSGKSHGIMSGMIFLPPELTWIIGISARFLYYTEELKRGYTIYLDELPSESTLLDSIKAIITSYPNGGKRGTVIEGKSVWQSVPARVTINTSSVDQKADEQFTNRMTVIRSASEKDKKKNTIDFRVQLYAGVVSRIDETVLESIHNAMRHIASKSFTVIVPLGAVGINDYDHIDTRVFNQFMGAIQGNAILNYPSRPHQINGNAIRVYVTKEDFDAVIHLYQKPDEYNLKLTPASEKIKSYLEKVFPEHKTLGEIETATGLAPNTVRTSIRGRSDRNVECLINGGYVEEVSVTSQEIEKEIRGSGSGEYERSKHVGERIGSKAYRAIKSPLKHTVKPKTDDAGDTNLGDFVGMVYWNQEKADEGTPKENPDTTDTNEYQELVLPILPVTTDIHTYTHTHTHTPPHQYIGGGGIK